MTTLRADDLRIQEADTGAAELAGPSWLRWLVPAGRLLFSLIFIVSASGHFSATTIAYARDAGVPLAAFLVPVSGLLALAGGLSVLFGYKARLGAGLLALFLVPVTLMMHAFWTIADPQVAQMQQAMFMKNVAMLGGALLIMYFGAGPVSWDVKHHPAVVFRRR